MKCGEFPAKANHRVIIQSRGDASDDYGGSAVTWSTLSTVWAIIEPMSGREVLQSEQLQSRVTHKITIRYNSTLKSTATGAKYRVSYDDRLFPVKFVQNFDEDMKSEGTVYQVLTCEENNAEQG